MAFIELHKSNPDQAPIVLMTRTDHDQLRLLGVDEYLEQHKIRGHGFGGRVHRIDSANGVSGWLPGHRRLDLRS